MYLQQLDEDPNFNKYDKYNDEISNEFVNVDYQILDTQNQTMIISGEKTHNSIVAHRLRVDMGCSHKNKDDFDHNDETN